MKRRLRHITPTTCPTRPAKRWSKGERKRHRITQTHKRETNFDNSRKPTIENRNYKRGKLALEDENADKGVALLKQAALYYREDGNVDKGAEVRLILICLYSFILISNILFVLVDDYFVSISSFFLSFFFFSSCFSLACFFSCCSVYIHFLLFCEIGIGESC